MFDIEFVAETQYSNDQLKVIFDTVKSFYQSKEHSTDNAAIRQQQYSDDNVDYSLRRQPFVDYLTYASTKVPVDVLKSKLPNDIVKAILAGKIKTRGIYNDRK